MAEKSEGSPDQSSVPFPPVPPSRAPGIATWPREAHTVRPVHRMWCWGSAHKLYLLSPSEMAQKVGSKDIDIGL